MTGIGQPGKFPHIPVDFEGGSGIAQSLWQEYLRVDEWPATNDDMRHGARCAIRCVATKLGVYAEFCSLDTSEGKADA